MNRIAHSLLVVVVLTLSLSFGGCARFSKEGRQQRAYAKYIRNASYARAKQSLKLRPGKVQLPPMPVSDPVTTTESGPMAMASSE